MHFPKIVVPALVLAAIGCRQTGVPTIHIGGDGVSVGTGDGRDPQEAYRNLHSNFTSESIRCKQIVFNTNPPNFVIGAEHSRDMVVTLRKMQKLLKEPFRTNLEPEIDWFERFLNACSRSMPTTTAAEYERHETVVRINFSISSVDLVDEFPDKPTPKTNGKPSPVDPQPKVADPQVKTTDPQPKTVEIAGWVFFKAWERLHADLEAKWSAGEDCRTTFERLVTALETLQGKLPKDKQTKLINYTDFYKTVQADTKGFKEVPKGGTKQDVLNQLNAVGSNIRFQCDPDK